MKKFTIALLTVIILISIGCSEEHKISAKGGAVDMQGEKYDGEYTGEYLPHIAFPMGGIGAGMICLEGTGTLSHFSLRHRPEIFNEPQIFSAICVKGEKNIARVLEGPVPQRKIFNSPLAFGVSGNGLAGKTYGLPRFAGASFKARFPFATVTLEDAKVPLKVQITGWSPFTPPDADDSSLPVAALEYKFINNLDKEIEAVYSFNAQNFMGIANGKANVLKIPNGFILTEAGSKEKPWEKSTFAVCVDSTDAKVNCAWFRGGWWDAITMAWKDVADGKCYEKPAVTEDGASPGGTIFVPIKLGAKQEKSVRVMLSWYVPESNVQLGEKKDAKDCSKPCDDLKKCSGTYKPWYSKRFKNIYEVIDHWRQNYASLRKKSEQFSNCFYDTTLPAEVIEAISANLTILKSPTVLRQRDGRLWCFEGCCDERGCCHGSCTHVWNYAQAICHLFPQLERSLRQTEFTESQNEAGHQTFRSALPICPVPESGKGWTHERHAACDGQLGGIMKVYRDWRIGGDTEWLRNIWPKVKLSLDYCIETWDPEHNGILSEPHHNTYDIEFWGPDGMCSSFYLGALKAAVEMSKAAGDKNPKYAALLEKGRKYLNEQLFDGEYFYQKIQFEGLRAKSDAGQGYSPEALELLKKEGPKYQYGKGCLSDGVLGEWMGWACGLDGILEKDKVASHLRSVHKYNLKKDLSEYANPQRPGFALGKDGGLLLCTWPKGSDLSLPFVYSNEVWTGIEYQVASHLISEGMVEEGLEVVRLCRDRYDGRIRNPFNEYECGHWYARAMSSYALLQGLTGARYDAVEKVLYLKPKVKGDFRSFLCTAGRPANSQRLV